MGSIAEKIAQATYFGRERTLNLQNRFHHHQTSARFTSNRIFNAAQLAPKHPCSSRVMQTLASEQS